MAESFRARLHNTLQVDGEELNRFVGSDALWQLHYDARPTGAVMQLGEGVDRFCGGHAGYTRLAPPVSHAREWIADKHAPRVLVRDRLVGEGTHALAWRFHLDPDVAPQQDGCDVRLTCGGRTIWMLPDDTAAAFSFSIRAGLGVTELRREAADERPRLESHGEDPRRGLVFVRRCSFLVSRTPGRQRGDERVAGLVKWL